MVESLSLTLIEHYSINKYYDLSLGESVGLSKSSSRVSSCSDNCRILVALYPNTSAAVGAALSSGSITCFCDFLAKRAAMASCCSYKNNHSAYHTFVQIKSIM